MSAYLAILDGQRGREVQIIYPLDGRAVGHPASWKPAAKLELPDRDEPWTIADALAQAEPKQ